MNPTIKIFAVTCLSTFLCFAQEPVWAECGVESVPRFKTVVPRNDFQGLDLARAEFGEEFIRRFNTATPRHLEADADVYFWSVFKKRENPRWRKEEMWEVAKAEIIFVKLLRGDLAEADKKRLAAKLAVVRMSAFMRDETPTGLKAHGDDLTVEGVTVSLSALPQLTQWRKERARNVCHVVGVFLRDVGYAIEAVKWFDRYFEDHTITWEDLVADQTMREKREAHMRAGQFKKALEVSEGVDIYPVLFRWGTFKVIDTALTWWDRIRAS